MAGIRRIDHVAIAVRDLETAIETFEKLLGAKLVAKRTGRMSGALTAVAYLKFGESIIALDAAVEPEGFIAKFIVKRGEGLHHVGLEVDDLDGLVADLEARGVRIPQKALRGKDRREIVLSPRDAHGVTFQVIEWADGDQPLEKRIERYLRFEDPK